MHSWRKGYDNVDDLNKNFLEVLQFVYDTSMKSLPLTQARQEEESLVL